MVRKIFYSTIAASMFAVTACDSNLPTTPATPTAPPASGTVSQSLSLPGSGLLSGLLCQLTGSVAVQIGPDGGNISLAGVTLTIPKGSLLNTQLIVLVPLPGDRPMVEFLPEGLKFAPEHAPTLTFNTACIHNPAHASIVYETDFGQVLENLGGMQNGSQLSTQIHHFSRYAVDW